LIGKSGRGALGWLWTLSSSEGTAKVQKLAESENAPHHEKECDGLMGDNGTGGIREVLRDSSGNSPLLGRRSESPDNER